MTDNPMAFPTSETTFGGMTLRDWFAGQALAGLLANSKIDNRQDDQAIAAGVYVLADAMLAERAK